MLIHCFSSEDFFRSKRLVYKEGVNPYSDVPKTGSEGRTDTGTQLFNARGDLISAITERYKDKGDALSTFAGQLSGERYNPSDWEKWNERFFAQFPIDVAVNTSPRQKAAALQTMVFRKLGVLGQAGYDIDGKIGPVTVAAIARLSGLAPSGGVPSGASVEVPNLEVLDLTMPPLSFLPPLLRGLNPMTGLWKNPTPPSAPSAPTIDFLASNSTSSILTPPNGFPRLMINNNLNWRPGEQLPLYSNAVYLQPPKSDSVKPTNTPPAVQETAKDAALRATIAKMGLNLRPAVYAALAPRIKDPSNQEQIRQGLKYVKHDGLITPSELDTLLRSRPRSAGG